MPARSPLVLYTYAKCSTCRDATRWLSARGIAFIERPIYVQPPSVAELQRMLTLQHGQIRRLFNSSGLQYRERGLAEKLPTLSQAEALALLHSDGRLVKRPFLLGRDVGLVGFDADKWAAALGT